jgi:Sulfotransferase domain
MGMHQIADRIKPLVSGKARRRIVRARLGLRVPTGRFRSLPDFLIIGGMRCGTSSLFKYLAYHPAVAASLRKEIQYLTVDYGKGENWYRSHFPTNARKWLSRFVRGRPLLTFEATPDYLFHPLAAARAAGLVPDARLIVLLRNPVARAWSHHQHMVALGYETLDFATAVATEGERIGADLEQLAVDPDHDPKALLRYSYLARGRYAEQLSRWFDRFPRRQFLVIRSEDFFRDTATWFAAILEFLGLEPWEPRAFGNESRLQGRPAATGLPPAAEERLRDVFAGPNAELAKLLGDGAFGW